MIARLYRGLSALSGPLLGWWLARRARAGKEDPDRLDERRGRDRRPRPAGRLVWVHGASVGETASALGLVARLLAGRPGLTVLVTSGTRASARMLAARLPAGACHAYVPLDHPAWVRRFLAHWRPDLVLWLESELWPNLVAATAAEGVPMVLVNARLSARSARGWARAPGWAGRLLGAFALVLAPDETQAARLRALGADPVRVVGNLKASTPLAVEPAALAQLDARLGPRPRWLAASTHPGEDAVVFAAHRRLRAAMPGLLLLLAPRHPERAAAIATDAVEAGLPVARHAAGEVPGPETAVYLVDTMGELGLFYRLAPVVFVAGSLNVGRGGHNVAEPARLGAAVLHGPDMANFAGLAAALARVGASETVADAPALADAVLRLLADPEERARRAAAGRAVAEDEAGALDATMASLAPLLARLDDGTAPGAGATDDARA